ncbi:14531_t:CDS:2 [Racocetra persica]|uniref:14531_t:CDS:1 n=1 Tax=Racocetra persica TaxID=160502 RepID=A0ACA9MS89_9GLOM|nr:14531_t:CDS:2 [Racocetra persica]
MEISSKVKAKKNGGYIDNCRTENILRNFNLVEKNKMKRLNQDSDDRDENIYTTNDDNERSTYNLRKRKKLLNTEIDCNSHDHESDNIDVLTVNDMAHSSDSGIDCDTQTMLQSPADDLYDSSEATSQLREEKNLHPISIGRPKDCIEWLRSDDGMALWKNRPARMIHVKKKRSRKPNSQSRTKNRNVAMRTRSLSRSRSRTSKPTRRYTSRSTRKYTSKPTRQYNTRSKTSLNKNKTISRNKTLSKNNTSKKNNVKKRTTRPVRGKLVPCHTGGKSRFMMKSYFQHFMKLNRNQKSSESSDSHDSNESNDPSDCYDSDESNKASDFYDSNGSIKASDFHNSDESNETFDFRDSDESNEIIVHDQDESNDSYGFHDSVGTDISGEDEESKEAFTYPGLVKRNKNPKQKKHIDTIDIWNARKDDERQFKETNYWELPLLGSSPIQECTQSAYVQFYESSTPSTDANTEESYFNFKSDFNWNKNKIVKKAEKIAADSSDDSNDLSTEDEEETVVMSSDGWSMSQTSIETHNMEFKQQCPVKGIFKSLNLSTPTHELADDALFDQTLFSGADLNMCSRPTTPTSEVNMSLEECIAYSRELTPFVNDNAYNNIDQSSEIDFDEDDLQEKTKDESLADYLQDFSGNYNGWYTPIWEVEDPITDLFRPLLDEPCVT